MYCGLKKNIDLQIGVELGDNKIPVRDRSSRMTDLAADRTLPLVSIIVLNWNKRKYLKRCLDSVLNTDYPRIEIMISDNGSTDGSVELINKEYHSVILIENTTNLGFCEGNNVAIKRAKGDIVVLLNNDTWVDKNWIKEIVKAASDPKVGVIGCKLFFADTNVIQSLGYHLHLLGHHINRGLLKVDDEKFETEKVTAVDYVTGSALAIKRSVISKIGLLDPTFYAYFEDADWCYRAKDAGYKVVVAPKAIVHHFGSVSWNNFSFKKVYLTERNRFYFILKHYYGLTLLKALTLHDLKYICQLIKTELRAKSLTDDLTEQKTTRKYADLVNRSNYREFAKAILNWVGAKFLAYLSISQLIIKNRKIIDKN